MRSQPRGSANRNGDPDFAALSSNPFARFSLGNGRLCLPSLTHSGLSAFAMRSQPRGSANRNGDWDLATLGSNPFARFVCKCS